MSPSHEHHDHILGAELFGGANGGGRHLFADSDACCPPPSLTSVLGARVAAVKNMNKHMALALAALALGFAGGYSIKVDSERNRAARGQEEMAQASELSRAALKATQCVMVLKLLRGNEPELAEQRLETLLDFALIDIAREYSPTRDPLGTASNALRFVKAYRIEHPRQVESDDIRKQADAAFRVIPIASP